MESFEPVGALFVAIFSQRGWVVQTAARESDALKRIAADTYDVVVIEHGPPQMDGAYLLASLRTRDSRSVAILTTTGPADELLQTTARGLADAILVKPFRVDSLTGFLDRCFSAGKADAPVRIE